MEEVLRYVRQKESDLSEMEERLRTGGTSRELRSLVRLGEEQLGRLRRELRLLGQGVEELEAEVGAEMNSQITQEEKERCEELTRTIETLKKEYGGERGIRTLETLQTLTHFPGVLLQPLGHLTVNAIEPQLRKSFME